MDAPLTAYILAACLLAGGLTGAADTLKESITYDGFIENYENYHLVDDAGNPVSQETK